MRKLNLVQLITGMLMVLTTMSFSSRTAPESTLIGTYGICDCGEGNSMKITLTINEDHTFHYYKNDDPGNIIDVNGNWIMDGNTLLLKDYVADNPIHHKWTADKKDNCLKSRKGFEWTRLCQRKPCN